jgi:hypothetical protein
MASNEVAAIVAGRSQAQRRYRSKIEFRAAMVSRDSLDL